MDLYPVGPILWDPGLALISVLLSPSQSLFTTSVIHLKCFQDSPATPAQICCSQQKSATVSPISPGPVNITFPFQMGKHDSSVWTLYICPAEGFDVFISWWDATWRANSLICIVLINIASTFMFSTNISHYVLISLQVYLTHNLLKLNQPDLHSLHTGSSCL